MPRIAHGSSASLRMRAAEAGIRPVKRQALDYHKQRPYSTCTLAYHSEPDALGELSEI